MNKRTSSHVRLDEQTSKRLVRLEAAALGELHHPTVPAKKTHAKRICRQLRERLIAGDSLDHLRERGLDVRALLERQSDEQIVQMHIQCPRCQAPYLPTATARRLMTESHMADHWLVLISDESLAAPHECVDGRWHHIGYRQAQRGAA